MNDLLQIQSPDFHEAGLVNAAVVVALPKALERKRKSLLKAVADNKMSSLKAPHLKQLERLAKLWAPQLAAPQYQSPGRTSLLLLILLLLLIINPNDEEELPPPLPPLILMSPPKSAYLESPHLWHDSLLWKFKCWHALHFQSPGLFILKSWYKEMKFRVTINTIKYQ